MKNFLSKLKILCAKNPIGVVLVSLCVITVLVCAILLATLIPRSDLTKIEIVTLPEKTEYIEGQSVDTKGMVVKAYHGKKGEIITDYTLDKKQLSLGDKQVNVSYAYKGVIKSASFDVNVVKKNLVSIEITQMPDKTHYLEHSCFDAKGMIVTAYYDNGNGEVIDNWDYDKKGKLQLEDTTVTISYGGKTAEIEIEIEAKVLLSIYIKSNPTKLTYLEGEYFDFLGVKIYAKYDNADDELIKDWDYDKKALLTVEDSAVEFSYILHGVKKTASVEITVEPAPYVNSSHEFVNKVLDLLPPTEDMTADNLSSIDYAIWLLGNLSQPTTEQLTIKQELESKREEIIESLPPEVERVFDVTYIVGGGLNFEDVNLGDNPEKYANSDGVIELSPAVSQIAVEQGYVFKGWLLDGQVVDKLENLTSDVTLYADFKLTATLVVDFVDYYDSNLLLELKDVDRTDNYDLQSIGVDTMIYSQSGKMPVAYFTTDRERVSSVDLSKGKTVVVYVVTAESRELHMDGNKGASVSWTFDFEVEGASEQTSKMLEVGNVFVIPIGATVKIVSMNVNISDIVVDGVEMGTNLNNTVVQAEFEMTQGEYAVSVTFKTKLSDMTTLSFLGYNQYSIVYPSGWDGFIASVDMDNLKFVYDEDNVYYVTEYMINGNTYYFDELAEYSFDGNTQIYVNRVRNSFSLVINYVGGQERIDGLIGKQSVQDALSELPADALITLNNILDDNRLYIDDQRSESLSQEALLATIMRRNIIVYSDWEAPALPEPDFGDVDYSDSDFVKTWSALFAKDSDVLDCELTLTADGIYEYKTFVNGVLSADISGIYRIENGNVAIKTMRLYYP
ncbi:MAG: bacterial Ig-like domain-containing protein [Clostridia bacterium]|nr:bacterial Ig-like domain-containing protein [Clostridia bacterium]